jgi:Putative transposase
MVSVNSSKCRPKNLSGGTNIIASLHSWGQRVLRHLHTHSVVSCGGLSLDGSTWIDVDPDDPRFDRAHLSKLYRHLFLKRLRRLFNQGRLTIPPTMPPITTLQDFCAWLTPIAAKPWNVNVQKPPEGCNGPETAIGYLGRYVAGTAVKDARIVHDDGHNITLRIKNYRNGGAKETITMPGPEFVRRFATHIVPPYCRRIRYAGLLGQSKRKNLLPRCRELLANRIPPTPDVDEYSDADAARSDIIAETVETPWGHSTYLEVPAIAYKRPKSKRTRCECMNSASERLAQCIDGYARPSKRHDGATMGLPWRMANACTESILQGG